MAEIIPFADAGRLVPHKRRAVERSAVLMADVIMFTGVRYERLEVDKRNAVDVTPLPADNHRQM